MTQFQMIPPPNHHQTPLRNLSHPDGQKMTRPTTFERQKCFNNVPIALKNECAPAQSGLEVLQTAKNRMKQIVGTYAQLEYK